MKSADTITYDDNGEVIPLSQRFDESKTDIRYLRTDLIDTEAEIGDNKTIGGAENGSKTPSYWNKEQYQPLVEGTTLYGNKVKVPKRFWDTWAVFEKCRHLMQRDLERLEADGLRRIPTSNKLKKDLQLVFYEIYEE